MEANNLYQNKKIHKQITVIRTNWTNGMNVWVGGWWVGGGGGVVLATIKTDNKHITNYNLN